MWGLVVDEAKGLCNNASLTHLNLSLNYKESSEKHRQKCLHQLVLLASSICPIEGAF